MKICYHPYLVRNASKFNNAVNFRGEAFVPGNDKMLATTSTSNNIRMVWWILCRIKRGYDIVCKKQAQMPRL